MVHLAEQDSAAEVEIDPTKRQREEVILSQLRENERRNSGRGNWKRRAPHSLAAERNGESNDATRDIVAAMHCNEKW